MRLFSPAEPLETVAEKTADRKAIQRSSVHDRLGWHDTRHEVRVRSYRNKIDIKYILYVTKIIRLSRKLHISSTSIIIKKNTKNPRNK